MKKGVIIGVAVLLVAVVWVWQYVPKNVQEDTQRPDSSGQPTVQGEAKFVLGQITGVEAGAIIFSVLGSDKKTAKVNNDTVLKKQVKEGDGVKLVDAQLGDFTSGVKIVVYYTQEPQDNNYKAAKVQIISY